MGDMQATYQNLRISRSLINFHFTVLCPKETPSGQHSITLFGGVDLQHCWKALLGSIVQISTARSIDSAASIHGAQLRGISVDIPLECIDLYATNVIVSKYPLGTLSLDEAFWHSCQNLRY